MKLTKEKIWILGIVATAILFLGVILRREDDQLRVHLVDKATGRPVNCAVHLTEYRDFPVLSSLKFLPSDLRGSARTQSLDLTNGTFQVARISKQSERLLYVLIVIKVHGAGELPMIYTKSEIGASIGRFGKLSGRIPIGADQTDVTIPIELPTKGETR
jgi:hypothetical protein